ncbi:hypothetical protein [Aerolutibacter ruishenii]|uniref:hypothetical protein n=1 Tax=Aerolutibacter ruishenii TaxID=686800 RepID=UPI0011A32227|nr:hypothetical protein [Lysobacter ruishenii]
MPSFLAFAAVDCVMPNVWRGVHVSVVLQPGVDGGLVLHGLHGSLLLGAQLGAGVMAGRALLGGAAGSVACTQRASVGIEIGHAT